jgi:hypothetical protein
MINAGGTNIRHGIGYMALTSGTIYLGQWKNNLYDGNGC